MAAQSLSGAKVLHTDYLYIDKNVICIGARFITAQNISMISMHQKEKNYFGAVMTVTMAVIAFILSYIIRYGDSHTFFLCIGIVLTIIALIMFCSQPDEYGIAISLNSGKDFWIEAEDVNFIRSITKTMLECINQKSDETYIVNVKDCKIDTANFAEYMSKCTYNKK